MKYTQKITIVILALALIIQPLFNKNISAASNNAISTQSATTSSIFAGLFIDSDGATRCTANVLGKPGTTKIAGTLKLKKGTTIVKSWNVSTTTQVLNVSKTCYLLSKGTYKLVLNVKVTCDGKSENLTATYTETY